MKRLILGIVGAGMLASAAPAMAQDYGHDWRDHQRYERSDRDRYDRDRRGRQDRRYGYGYFNYRHRVCAWRYGERVCWYQNG